MLDDDVLRELITKRLEAFGGGARRFEQSVGLKQGALRGILHPTRRQSPSLQKTREICDALGLKLNFEDIHNEHEGPSTVPLVGFAGAGGSVAYNGQLHDGETALAPPGTAEGLVAIEVRGDSATPFLHEGDRIYIRPDYPANPINHIGQFVLATATDGAAWIKILLNGNTTGLWNLHSTNPLCSLMEDVELDHVSPLVWVHFKRQNRLVKRDN